MNIVKLRPAGKDYIWGGSRLIKEFGKSAESGRLAETWELSCHPDGPSVVCGGEFAGMTLAALLERYPEAAGTRAAAFPEFPVLIKLIDAEDNLSVQVHPDDEYARRVENSFGKTEVWIVVDCQPGAQLLYGFRDKLSREEFKRRIEENTLLDVVRAVPVKKGDVFFIDAGTLHAIGKGILIAEVQQSSNITYRVYDYGRVDAQGNPRELHTEKAAEVTVLEPPARPVGSSGSPVQTGGGFRCEIADCPYFHVEQYDINGIVTLNSTKDSFQSLLCTDGALTLKCGETVMEIKKGDSIFVPAGSGEYACSGTGVILVTSV